MSKHEGFSDCGGVKTGRARRGWDGRRGCSERSRKRKTMEPAAALRKIALVDKIDVATVGKAAG